jgi:hypothetical protein
MPILSTFLAPLVYASFVSLVLSLVLTLGDYGGASCDIIKILVLLLFKSYQYSYRVFKDNIF